jgi:alanyl-tRNA synthetase
MDTFYMNSRDIREAFLQFFEARGHQRVPSSPLVPARDPTLLFTNAGMNQFKDVFLGVERRPYKRATTVQKCMRAGGKHNDLDNVGFTPRHHTFFEMLGNFSFGDYFKREAISWAWELVTDVFRLPTDRLWVTVYETDDEAFDLWHREVGVPTDRIVRLGKADNFWAMGETGPCGPCSEIHYDLGPEAGCGRPTCAPGCDCGRFLEFWNLVFMQYNCNERGELEPLPNPSIDTGMGLERIASILQGTFDNFHTDLFKPILGVIADELRVDYPTGDRAKDIALRVMADHARAIAFVLSEGVLPSNEGRGYVLRKIIRRALRFGQVFDRHEPYMYKFALFVVDFMKDVYPELEMGKDIVRNACYAEEERFFRVIETGLERLREVLDRHRADGVLPGEEVFRLYDTYGLPVDLAEEVAREAGLRVDLNGFERELREQQERARRAWKGEEALEGIAVYRELSQRYETRFHGYRHLRWEDARVLALLNGQKQSVRELREGERGEVILDETVFYGESGGQVGDVGVLHTPHAQVQVVDTKIYFHRLIVHHVVVREGVLRVGDSVSMEVPYARRWATMRHHTGTHLIHWALREYLGYHVKQAGSLVAPDRLRFDFTHFSALSPSDIQELERMVNRKVWDDYEVEEKFMPLEEALRRGALAFFGEKYPDIVRVIQIGDFSKELCGGTHVYHTGWIGPFVIVRESSVGAGLRRVEALAGEPAVQYLQTQRELVQKALQVVKSSEHELIDRLQELLERNRSLQKELDRLRRRQLEGETVATLFHADETVHGVHVIVRGYTDVPVEDLRVLADRARTRENTVAVLGSRVQDRAFLVVGVHKALTDRLPAHELVRSLAPLVGGGGGGRPDFAQAGGARPDRLEEALREALTLVRQRISASAPSQSGS